METKDLFKEIHENAINKGFWGGNHSLKYQIPDNKINFNSFTKCPTFLALIHSEVSEALEAYRNNDLPNFKEEIADIVIRVFDLCAGIGMDWNELKKIIIDKHEFNKLRPPMHGGKKC